MKLISFMRSGSATYGVVVGEKVLDLKPLLGSEAADLKTVIEKISSLASPHYWAHTSLISILLI